MDRSGCPCGNTVHYKDCCKPFHDGEKVPESAELLMKSRYSAYVKNLAKYLEDTWHAKTRPVEFQLDKDSGFRWLKLEVTDTQENANEATVSFKAVYNMNGQEGVMQEKSKFLKEDGKWYYLDGAQS